MPRAPRLTRLTLVGLIPVLFACSSQRTGTSDSAIWPDRTADRLSTFSDLDRSAGRPEARPDSAVCEGDHVTAGTPFGAPVGISDPTLTAFLPVVASSGSTVLIAWHEFAGSSSRVAYRTAKQGCLGPRRLLTDPFGDQKQVSVATTAAGFILAYEARDGTTQVIRTVDLDVDGNPGAPVTVVASGWRPQVAAAGNEVAWAWTDGKAHYFARRGSIETLGPTPVGTKLLSTGLLNFPRIALDAQGTLHLAYRDGGALSEDWDILLVTRSAAGSFSTPINVSKSAKLLSDDIDLALESDGTLDIAWVDQDALNVNSFEVQFATRSPSGTISSPQRFGTQGQWSWTPSLVPGLRAAWRAGGAGPNGPFYYAEKGKPPTLILAPLQGAFPSLARDNQGLLHLAVCNDKQQRQVHYAIGTGL